MFEACDGAAGECGPGEVCGAGGEVGECMCLEDKCGNKVIDPGENCDGEDLGGEDCASRGYAGPMPESDGLATACRMTPTRPVASKV